MKKNGHILIIHPYSPNWLFWKLTLKTKSDFITMKNSFNRIYWYIGWQKKNSVLSTNCSRLISTHFEPTWTPTKMPFLIASRISPANSSATIRNKKGANRSPYLSPLFSLNSEVGLPFTNIEIVANSKQALIQDIHLLLNPILPITYIKKSQSTEW